MADSTITWLFPFYSGQGNYNQIQAFDSTGTGGGERFFFLGWEGEGVGSFQGQAAEIGFVIDPGIFLFSVGEVDVEVTYFGEPGDYIIGTFTGTMEGTDQNGTVIDTFEYTGSFSVFRQ